MFRRLPTYQIVIDAVLGAAFLAVSLLIQFQTFRNGPTPWNVILAVVTCVVFTAAVLARRAAPGLALVIAWAGGVLQMATGQLPAFVDIAVPAVIYTAAAYGSRRVSRWGLASAVVGAFVGSGYLLVWYAVDLGRRPQEEDILRALLYLIGALLVAALAWAIGALVALARRAREAHRARLRAEEDAEASAERVRIARDMHDVVAHSLAVVIAQADGARYAAASTPGAVPDATTQALTAIATTARSALADVRLLLGQLRHTQDAGPIPGIADLDELFARTRAAGLALSVRVEPAVPSDVPTAVQLAVYRILQEALTNALRHGAGSADVALSWQPDRVQLRVQNPVTAHDDAAGERPARDTAGAAAAAVTPARGGHGLVGMRERARVVGGTLDVAARDGVFIVDAGLPVPLA